MGLNITGSQNTVSFSVNEKAGTVLTDLYNNKEYTVSAEQTVTVDIPAAANGGTVILGVKAADDSDKIDDAEDTTKEDTAKEEGKDTTENKAESLITEAVGKVFASFKDTVEVVIDTVRTLKNKDITIAGSVGVLPEGAKFEVSSLAESAASYIKAKGVLKEKKLDGKFTVYEINLMGADGAQIHQLGDYVVVTLPVPEGFTVSKEKTIGVYRLEYDGTLTKCSSEVKDGKLSFSTNHFSTYIFVEENVANENVTTDNKGNDANSQIANASPALASVKTGDDTCFVTLFIFVLIGIAIATGAFAYSTKKKTAI